MKPTVINNSTTPIEVSVTKNGSVRKVQINPGKVTLPEGSEVSSNNPNIRIVGMDGSVSPAQAAAPVAQAVELEVTEREKPPFEVKATTGSKNKGKGK